MSWKIYIAGSMSAKTTMTLGRGTGRGRRRGRETQSPRTAQKEKPKKWNLEETSSGLPLLGTRLTASSTPQEAENYQGCRSLERESRH